MSFYWKTRTLISGDYREVERNLIEYNNKKVIAKYKGKEDIYCVIRVFSDEGGLFCLWFKALEGIRYSLQNGFIPVIDMQTKENILTTKAQRKQINIWEKFFEQPVKDYHYEDVKNKPNKVIIENPMGPIDYCELCYSPEILSYWRKLVNKYSRYSGEVIKSIDLYEKKFGDMSDTLGVLARGTDYLNPALGHLIKLGTEDIADIIDEKLEKYNLKRVFVATEDSNILDALKEKYGDRLMYVEQKRYKGETKAMLGHLDDYVKDAVDMNIAYLTAMHLLSRCEYFWGAKTTGSMGVNLMRLNGFKEFELWKSPLDINLYDETKL